MPQYPQGIFQSLQWLMKKVKILALQKQPTYTGISLVSTSYELPGKGIYEVVSAPSEGNGLRFPDPVLMNGETIIVINKDSTYSVFIVGTYIPFIQGQGIGLNSIPAEGFAEFISINGEWICKNLI
jgi:hypothetical protein